MYFKQLQESLCLNCVNACTATPVYSCDFCELLTDTMTLALQLLGVRVS
jgi:hypothetical protein